MKIFHEPSYDRFRLLDVEKTNENLKSMKEVQPYAVNEQTDNVEISEEGMNALRENLKEVHPDVEEPIGYELTIQDTNEVEWEHYIAMREYSGLTLKDGNYNLEDVMKSMMDQSYHRGQDRNTCNLSSGSGKLSCRETGNAESTCCGSHTGENRYLNGCRVRRISQSGRVP